MGPSGGLRTPGPDWLLGLPGDSAGGSPTLPSYFGGHFQGRPQTLGFSRQPPASLPSHLDNTCESTPAFEVAVLSKLINIIE